MIDETVDLIDTLYEKKILMSGFRDEDLKEKIKESVMNLEDPGSCSCSIDSDSASIHRPVILTQLPTNLA